MENKTGGPAFPQDYEHTKVLVQMQQVGDISAKDLQKLSKQLAGMTLRQYAAIKLKVPNSGTDWLDEMIKKSLHDDLAAKAMQSLLCLERGSLADAALTAYMMADAMLTERKGGAT